MHCSSGGKKSSILHRRFSLSAVSVASSLSVHSSTRGPDGVKIENSDSAVATATGLQVGTYEFTLTVTDERKLHSSDMVTVIVREGLFFPCKW